MTPVARVETAICEQSLPCCESRSRDGRCLGGTDVLRLQRDLIFGCDCIVCRGAIAGVANEPEDGVGDFELWTIWFIVILSGSADDYAAIVV